MAKQLICTAGHTAGNGAECFSLPGIAANQRWSVAWFPQKPISDVVVARDDTLLSGAGLNVAHGNTLWVADASVADGLCWVMCCASRSVHPKLSSQE